MTRSLIAILLVFCIPLESLAAGPNPPKTTAIVSADASTTVSGTSVTDKMSVFPNDDVETHSAKPAEVTFEGTSLTVLGNSHIRFHESFAELLSGGAIVTTRSEFTLRSSCLSAQPLTATISRYSVVPFEKQVFIQVEQGDLLVKARKDVRVSAGKTVEITSCGKPDEAVHFIEKNGLALKGLIAAGAAMGAVSPIIFKGNSAKPAISGECPAASCP